MEKPNDVMQAMFKREREIKIIRFNQLNHFSRKGEIVLSGSSLMEQFPVNEMLMTLGKNHIVYNRGIGGDTTLDLLNDLDSCIFDLEPGKLFLNIGTNDIGKPDYDEDTLVSNYRLILARIHDRLPGTEVYLLSYYPVNPNKDSDIPEEFKAGMFVTRTNKAIESANKRVRQLAEELSHTYVDVSTPLFDETGNLKEAYTVEGVHMWPAAYQKVLEILLDYFE